MAKIDRMSKLQLARFRAKGREVINWNNLTHKRKEEILQNKEIQRNIFVYVS